MDRQEKVQIMINVKQAVIQLLDAVFTEIDRELESLTFKSNDEKIIKSSMARLFVRSLKVETLERVKNIGSGYEPTED